MRFIIFISFLLSSGIFATTGYSQAAKINIGERTTSIRSVLKIIEEQSNYRFFYNSELIDLDKEIILSIDNKNINETLKTVFAGTTVGYRVLDNHFVVLSSAEVLQQISVTGTITDDNGEPMPGVNVVVKGTTVGVITDIDGKYSIAIPDANAVLTFSFVGYATQEQAVGSQRVINVALAEDTREIDEVVVVAYGTARKKDLTVAAEVVGEKQLLKTPTASLAQSLQGNTSGVMVAATSAEPGADVTIRIRGSASISASNDPLVIIDNVPSTMSDFTMLNPTDVVSITVLKDAAATAPYGSRASNGVLMITTKKGREGKMEISISGNYSFQRLQNVMDVMDGPQYASYANLAYFNAGAAGLPYSDLSNISSTDFQRMLTQNGHYAQANAQISGGTDRITYFVSANVVDQKGVTLNSQMSRLNLRANLTAKLRDNLKFTFNSNVAREERQTLDNRGNDSGPMFRNARINPALEIKPGVTYENGWFTDPTTGEQFYLSDVTISLLARQNYSRPFTFSTSGQLDWTIIPGLTANIRGGVNYRDQLGYSYTPRATQRSSGNARSDNKALRNSSTRMSWFSENFLIYTRKFNDVHNMSITAGQSAEKNVSEGFGVTVTGFDTDDYTWNNLGASLNYAAPAFSTSSSFKTMVSVFSILSYNYAEKYYFNGTYRADASSRFGANSKWGYFPSASVMWNAKNEDFLYDNNVLSQLKLRLSWGITGNDAISQGTSLSFVRADRTATINGYDLSAGELQTMGNPDIRWEKTNSYNIGLETGFLNDALTLTFDAYYKKTTDLLYNAMLPLTTGINTIASNLGSVENKGIELTLNSRNIARNNFRWSTNFNFSWNANKVLDLGGEDIVNGYSGSGALNSSNIGNGGVSSFLKVGEPMYVFMGYRTSIWQNWDEIYSLSGNINDYSKQGSRKLLPGMYRYWGNGADGTLTTELDDRVILGHTIPDFMAGITNTFTYKDFELAVFFVGSWGNKIFNGNSSSLLQFATQLNSFTRALDAYRPMNVLTGDVGYSGEYPTPVVPTSDLAPNASPNGGNSLYANATSKRFIEDGSYLRLKTLSLTYNLPNKICQKLGIQQLSIFANAMNLWTLTKYSGMDPEMSSTQISSAADANQRFGIDLSAAPAFKTYTLGLNFKF